MVAFVVSNYIFDFFFFSLSKFTISFTNFPLHCLYLIKPTPLIQCSSVVTFCCLASFPFLALVVLLLLGQCVVARLFARAKSERLVPASPFYTPFKWDIYSANGYMSKLSK